MGRVETATIRRLKGADVDAIIAIRQGSDSRHRALERGAVDDLPHGLF